jgi:hypothetical protein
MSPAPLRDANHTKKTIMNTYLSVSAGIVALLFSACDKSLTEANAARGAQPNRSPFGVLHGPVYSVSIEDGKYRIDSSVVWEGKNKVRLIEQLEKENLAEKTSISEMPVFMKSFFDGLYASNKMEIADPGQEWKDGNPEIQLFDKYGKPLNNVLPNKQLVYLGLGKEMALFSYYVGGRSRSQEMVIVRFSGETITDLYFERNTALVTHKSAMVKYMREHQSQGGC